MKLTGIATGPATHRNVGAKNQSVYGIEVLDADGGTIDISAWSDNNPWPDAKMGTRIDATINRVTVYKGKTQATLVTTAAPSTTTPPKA